MKNVFGSIRSASDKFSVLFFSAGIAIVVANTIAGCAGWGQTTCKVIDLANSACPPVVQFIGEDGKPQQMTLTHEDARQLAGAKREAAARDAGADGSK